MRELTVAALAKTYRRLNVHIDHYHGESMYPIDRALAPFKDRLKVTEEGKKVVDIGEGLDPVTVVKSDGSSLYITRDVAAALHRKEIFEVRQTFNMFINRYHAGMLEADLLQHYD